MIELFPVSILISAERITYLQIFVFIIGYGYNNGGFRGRGRGMSNNQNFGGRGGRGMNRGRGWVRMKLMCNYLHDEKLCGKGKSVPARKCLM